MQVNASDLFAAFIAAMSVPSAITGFCFWLIERRIEKRDEKEDAERKKRQGEVDEREKSREQLELHIIKSVSAAISLGEATARAVQRIPDAKCNGDMKAALEYAQQVKHEQNDFLNGQGVKNIIR